MSFSSDVKNELARIKPLKACCKVAELAGFIRVCGIIKLAGKGKIKLLIPIENPGITRHYKILLKEALNIDSTVRMSNNTFQKRGHLYELNISSEKKAEELLMRIGILTQKDGFMNIDQGISEGLLKSKCCRKSYLKGAFLGAGTISDPDKGYHLEIACNSELLAKTTKKIFNSFLDINSKVVKRKNQYVVYLKDSEQIGDMLNIMGALGQFSKYQDVKIIKELRNKTNRISNCDNANLDKTLNAAEQQIKDILKIKDRYGLEWLPEKLRDAAISRLENPEVSLVELGTLMEPPMKKSGIHHRFKKIKELADNI